MSRGTEKLAQNRGSRLRIFSEHTARKLPLSSTSQLSLQWYSFKANCDRSLVPLGQREKKKTVIFVIKRFSPKAHKT